MKYAFKNGHILDGTLDMEDKTGLVVLVNDDKIEDIVSEDSDLTGYEVIDLKGQYLMPGLINLHIHFAASGKPKKKQTDPEKLVKRLTSNALMRSIVMKMMKGFAKTELYSGVTTLRAVGGVTDFDSRLRDLVNENKAVGPRIIACNNAVTVSGGHMAGSVAIACASIDECLKKINSLKAEGVDMIKLMITGGVLDAKVKGEPGVLRMQPDYVKACCDEAHRLGLKVAAHVESPEGVKVALENGVDTIEHGAKLDDHMIDLFKNRERKAYHVCTLSPALPLAMFDPSVSGANEMVRFNSQVVFDGVRDCAIKCLENNVPVGLGTDTACPYITHYDMWRELNYFSKYCNVSTNFALHTATEVNAMIAGLEDVTGTISKGKCADMIVCEKNPLEDLSRLRKLSYVVARGKVIKNPVVKKMDQCEKELDKFI